MSNNKTLVVGATGTVGAALVLHLVAAGKRVHAATREPSRELGDGVEAVLYDYEDPSTFDAALEGVDSVFYLTRSADPRAAAVAAPLFEKAASVGVRHIVNMSALGVADDSALRQVEVALAGSGVPYSLLRPNWFMQNFSTGAFGDMIRGHRGLYLPAASARCSFIDTRDIAAVAAKLLVDGEPAGRTYDLTGPESLTFAQVVGQLSAAGGSPICYVPISDADMEGALEAQGMPDYAIAFMLRLFGALRAGRNAAVSAAVEEVLGRPPRSLDAFAQELDSGLYRTGA